MWEGRKQSFNKTANVNGCVEDCVKTLVTSESPPTIKKEAAYVHLTAW